MKKRAKLTQEQLKAVLQGWKTTLLACCIWDIGEHLSDERVYTQIEELIEDSDAITVTRERLEHIASNIQFQLFPKPPMSEKTWVEVIEFLAKELGVEVVEPETIH